MTKGRKPKPTVLKLLEGNPGKRPINENEIYSGGTAVCPQWLEGEAKAEWERMSGVLENMGLLTDMDMTAFAAYCQAYARWKEAEEYLSKNGSVMTTPSGYMQQVPQVSIAQTYLKIMERFMVQFGLTPSARSRLDVNKNEKDSIDEMEKLLSGG